MLLALQGIDDEARGFEKERDDRQGKLKRLEQLLALMTQGLEDKKAKLDEATRFYKLKDGELKTDQEKVQKAKQKLQAVTKGKEFMAMQKEIESLRRTNASREEEILKLVAAMDEFKQNIEAEQTKIDSLRAELSEEESKNSARIQELETEIAAIAEKKAEVVKLLPKPLYSQYQRVYKARGGVAVVAIKNNACGGCNVRIIPLQLAKIIRCEELEICRSCARFLFAEHQEVAPGVEE